MKTFRLTLFAIICLLGITAAATTLPDETLHYSVTYKWGLIQKEAGTATLTLRNKGDNYNMTLTAASKPWADKIYSVRDTLKGIVTKKGFFPQEYVKVAHEDGKYSYDRITYTRAGGVTLGKAERRREKKGKITTTEKQLSATGAAFDMLSVFYYVRTFNYAAMKPGETFKTTVFSGKKSELLTVTYQGVTKLSLPGKSGKQDAYHITFSFTTDGKNKSSDDMEAWLSTDAFHTALQLVGKLPVGQVKVILK